MSTTTAQPRTDVFAQLENDACPFCGAARLERGRYEDDDAVLCTECEAPLVRVST